MRIVRNYFGCTKLYVLGLERDAIKLPETVRDDKHCHWGYKDPDEIFHDDYSYKTIVYRNKLE